MKTDPSKSRLAGPLLLACSVLLLSGCSGSQLSRTFGLTRDAPDEFTVTTRAPLSMPPDFDLRPPRPGAPRPQEQSDRQLAEDALVPQLALGAPQGSMSPGQEALLQQVGPAAPSNIGSEVDAETARESDHGLISKILNWRRGDIADTQVDAPKEAARLRHDAAIGASPDVGSTPIIQPGKTGWLSHLFSWL